MPLLCPPGSNCYLSLTGNTKAGIAPIHQNPQI
jgi:hypothetical protein